MEPLLWMPIASHCGLACFVQEARNVLQRSVWSFLGREQDEWVCRVLGS